MRMWRLVLKVLKTSTDCGKAQITGEVIGDKYYRINTTFIAERYTNFPFTHLTVICLLYYHRSHQNIFSIYGILQNF
uniref:Secreted protein n=1 Tax=Heterorhabditis bacteriophora TaxID=37862 RepID=A0A1I7WI02_HETBA